MTQVATLNLRYVQEIRKPNGRRLYYYRRHGYPRVALPGEVGSAEFMAAYAGAHAYERHAPGELIKPKSTRALVVGYYNHSYFTDLKPSTQRAYKNQLERFCDRYGHLSAVHVLTRHLDDIFEEMKDTPAQRANLRKRLRKVFRLAVKWDWRRDNPVRETDPPKYKAKGFIPWSAQDMAAFEARWASGTRERLAYAIFRYSLLRRSDACQAGRQHVKDGRLKMTQTKTGVEVDVPVLSELQAEIDAAPLGLTFLVTQYGAPFTPAGLTKWFVGRAEMAGLKNRTPHGLRKATAAAIAEGEGSDKGIAAALGQQTTSEVGTYTKSARQAKLADDAFAKLARAEK